MKNKFSKEDRWVKNLKIRQMLHSLNIPIKDREALEREIKKLEEYEESWFERCMYLSKALQKVEDKLERIKRKGK